MALSVGPVILVGETDLAAVHVEQSMVADRDAVRVTTDVVHDLLRPGERSSVHDPLGLPQRRERRRPRRPIPQGLE